MSVRLSIVSLILVLAGCGSTAPPPEIKGPFEFHLPDLDGNLVRLQDLSHEEKLILIDIWGTWCDPCRRSIPELSRISREYSGELTVIGIAFELEEDEKKRREVVRDFVEAHEIPYLVLMGGDTSAVERVLPAVHSFSGFPAIILLDRQLHPLYAETGFSKGRVKRALESNLY